MNTIKYVFPKAKLEEKKLIEEIIKSETKNYKINQHHVMLVFHELYHNAYLNNYHWPSVKLKFLEHSIIIRIDCEGKGFDYEKYLQLTKEDIRKYRLKNSGRGIMMVEKISTRLIYNKKGNNVIAQLKEHKEDKNEKS